MSKLLSNEYTQIHFVLRIYYELRGVTFRSYLHVQFGRKSIYMQTQLNISNKCNKMKINKNFHSFLIAT